MGQKDSGIFHSLAKAPPFSWSPQQLQDAPLPRGPSGHCQYIRFGGLFRGNALSTTNINYCRVWMATELYRGGSETMRITSAVSVFPMSSGQGWNHHQVTCRGQLCVEQRNFLKQSPQGMCPAYLLKCSYPAGWLSQAICAGCCSVFMRENWPAPLGDLSSSRPFSHYIQELELKLLCPGCIHQW